MLIELISITQKPKLCMLQPEEPGEEDVASPESLLKDGRTI